MANNRFSSPFISLPVGLRGSVSGENTTFTGTLNAGKPLGDEGAQLRLAGRRARLERDHRARLFAQRVMWDADDGGVDDGRMLVERILHFDAVDVFAAADQHVLGAIEDVAKAFVVEPGNVAGAEPAVDEGRGRGFGIVPIALTMLGPLTHSSPTPPGGNSLPVSSMIFMSPIGNAGPQLAGRAS